MKPIIFCRAFFGMTLFLYYLSVLPNFQKDFGPKGILGFKFFQNFPSAETYGWYLSSFHVLQKISSPIFITSLYLTLLISSLLFSLGIKIRTTGSAALILHALFHARNEYMFWGWAEMIKPFMIYVILVGHKKNGPAWPLRLLQFHICSMYFITAWARLGDGPWQNGSVILEIFDSSLFARFYPPILILKPLAPMLGIISWFLELGAPLILWFRRLGPYWAMALIAMHIAMEIFTLVGWWNFIMIGALLTFLIKNPLKSSVRLTYKAF